ncbi:hypothetical protein H70357_01520 [Paenibacillus sp. FSL H7-0357]|nr:hypothetical protein H70357_01520 [Paenibacillus sp. FSL H7-0357]
MPDLDDLMQQIATATLNLFQLLCFTKCNIWMPAVSRLIAELRNCEVQNFNSRSIAVFRATIPSQKGQKRLIVAVPAIKKPSQG